MLQLAAGAEVHHEVDVLAVLKHLLVVLIVPYSCLCLSCLSKAICQHYLIPILKVLVELDDVGVILILLIITIIIIMYNTTINHSNNNVE